MFSYLLLCNLCTEISWKYSFAFVYYNTCQTRPKRWNAKKIVDINGGNDKLKDVAESGSSFVSNTNCHGFQHCHPLPICLGRHISFLGSLYMQDVFWVQKEKKKSFLYSVFSIIKISFRSKCCIPLKLSLLYVLHFLSAWFCYAEHLSWVFLQAKYFHA